LFGLETMSGSLRRAWPKVLGIVLVAAGFFAGWRKLGASPIGSQSGKQRSSSSPEEETETARPRRNVAARPMWVLTAISVFWVALFCNNLPQFPAKFGFDRNGHLCYIDYIRHNHKLPLADEEWETFQPPLYYLLSTALLSAFPMPPDPPNVPWYQVSVLPEWHTNTALIGLRAFSAFIGLANVWLVFLCLRLVFPKRLGAQIVGTALAAFVPPSIYMSHQITNEGLAASFVTAALYFCFRVVLAKEPGRDAENTKAWILNYLGVGVFLGLAMLTKFSALLVFPAIFGTLIWAAWRPGIATTLPSGTASVSPAGLPERENAATVPAHSGVSANFRNVGMGLAAIVLPMLAICYWHYARVWQHFGKPFVGNWDPMLPFHWWQDPGYRTASWYGRMGESFVRPVFSGMFSFVDGIYSSLWGDGYCSAGIRTRFRPPWDYDLMNAGYLGALVPTALVLAGLIIVAIRFLRKPRPLDFLLLTLICASAGGILLMSLRIASYAQVKAFYALPALAGFCVLGVIGWEWAVARGQRWKAVVNVALAAWVLTACGTFWIRSANPMTWSVRGIQSTQGDRLSQAAQFFRRALEIDPAYLPAHVGLTDALAGIKEWNAAFQQAQTAVTRYPSEAAPHSQLATLLQLAGDPTNALSHFQQALALAPETESIHRQLGACLEQLHRQTEAAVVYQDGLKLHPLDTGLISALAAILASSPEAALRNGPRAVRLAERAGELTGFRDPACLATLAAAYAETDKFEEAIAAAETAQKNALAVKQSALAEQCKKMLESFRSRQPWRRE
jgi:tetratricopeptide (TPR) repeat protein